MSNSTENLQPHPIGAGGRTTHLPVDGGAHIRQATMVAQLNATSMLCPATTGSSGPVIGVSEHESDNSGGADAATRCKVNSDRIYAFANSSGNPMSEAIAFGSLCYAEDDHTIASTGTVLAGFFMGMEPDGKVRVFVSSRRVDADTDLADLASTSGAGMIGILDSGTFTAQTTVEAALQELYQDVLGHASIVIPLTAFREVSSAGAVGNDAANGGVLSSQTTPVLGAETTTEQMAIIFAAAVQDIIATSISLPADLDDAADITVDLMVLTDNTGGGGIEAATYSLLTTFDNGSQVTDTATDDTPATTLHTITGTIDAGDVPASASTMSLQLVHGTHANDPTHLLGVRVNYKRKLVTA